MTLERFFKAYSSDFIYATIVIAVVLVLLALTNPVLRWVMKKESQRIGGEVLTSISLVKRLLNALWLILGLIALGYIIVDEDHYSLLNANFKLVLYLGIIAVLTIVAGASLNHWFKRTIRQRVLRNEDPTSFKFLRYVAVAVVYVTGMLFGLLAIPSLHGVAQTALGGAGVIALIVGVSSQEALSNLIGGMFIIAFKPFKIGDVVAIDNTIEGTVTDITLRHTVIRTWKNRMIVIPNSIINKEKLVNYNLGEEKCCEYVEMGISYDSNVDLAKEILREECEKHPLILDNRTEEEKRTGIPVVKVALIEFADSAVKLRAWAWASTFGNTITLKRDVFETVKKRYDAMGIEIPFPHRTVVIKKDDAPERKTKAPAR